MSTDKQNTDEGDQGQQEPEKGTDQYSDDNPPPQPPPSKPQG